LDKRKVIPDGRAFGVNKVKAGVHYIDKNYTLECCSKNRITETGLLEVAKLKPKKKSLPEFKFRWDEKADTLDVDIYKNGKLCNELWDTDGYNGHHTKRVSKDKIFEVFIKTPNGVIFDGQITSPLYRKLESTAGISFKNSSKGVWMDKNGNVKRVDLR